MSDRIVLVVPAFPKLSETFIASQFTGLLKCGWDVHIVCTRSDRTEWGHFPELCRISDVRRRIHVQWPTKPRWIAGLLLFPAMIRSVLANPSGTVRYLYHGIRQQGLSILQDFYLDANIIALRPQLVHFEFGTLAVNKMYLKQWLNTKILVSFRGYDLNYVGLETPGYYDAVWNQADAVHLLGEDLWKRALQRGCPPSKPHFLIPPAIDSEFFNPGERVHRDICGSPERPLRVLSVGRLDWRKGYEWALQAVQLLINMGIHTEYRVVGDGDFLEAFMFARHQLGLEDTVRWLGAQPHAEIRAQMQWADVFLHAAVSEGFCNAVLEAQAMSLPVVCSNAGGLSENIVHGETGYVVPRRDPEQIAKWLAVLARDPALRQRMGIAGRQRVQKYFQIHQQIQAFDRAYHAILEDTSNELT